MLATFLGLAPESAVGWAAGAQFNHDYLLLTGKPELKGFNLNPLNQDELKALKVILKG